MQYFAYGSNLLTQRLVARCPSARAIGPAVLDGHSLRFAKYSWMDGSGKATIAAGDDQVQGMLFEMAMVDHAALDAIEGVGKGYDRWEGVEVLADNRPTTAVTYIASDPRDALRPFDWYLALILAGAQQHGLAQVAQAVADVSHQADPQADRPGRVAAIAALEAAGHGNWRRLLTR